MLITTFRRSLIAAAACSLLLAGCATSDTAGEGSSPTATVTVTAPPPSTPGAEEESVAPEPVPALGEAMLLPAVDMPEWNRVIVWESAPPEYGDAALPACPTAPPDLAPLVQTERSYSIDGAGMVGRNQLMLFADEETALAGFARLEDWLAACYAGDEFPPRRNHTINKLPAMSTWSGGRPCGDADVQRGCDPDYDIRFEFTGVGRSGNVISLVMFSLTAQDANWCDPPLDQYSPTCMQQDPLLASLAESLALVSTPTG